MAFEGVLVLLVLLDSVFHGYLAAPRKVYPSPLCGRLSNANRERSFPTRSYNGRPCPPAHAMHPDPSVRYAAVAAARRTSDIHPFRVMEVLARAKALEASGRNVLHLEIGEPDFTAPPSVVEAATRAVRSGNTAYTDSLGLPELRAAIARHYLQRFGCEVPVSRIAITSGASAALLLALAVYVERDREFLVPDPGYPGYRCFVRLFEGAPRSLAVSPGHAFQPTAGDIERA